MKLRELYNKYVIRGLRTQRESEEDYADFGKAVYREYLAKEDELKIELFRTKEEIFTLLINLELEKNMKPNKLDKIKNILNKDIVSKYFPPSSSL